MTNSFVYCFICVFILSFALVSCSEKEYGDVNSTRITKGNLDATFTITAVPGSPNKFVVTYNNKNVITSNWDLADGKGFAQIASSDTLMIPDAGVYSVRHFVVGAGGVVSDTISKTVTVATSDPVAGNLIKGGKFANQEDISQWTVDNIGGSCVIADGWATFKNNAGSWGQAALQQPLEVVAGKKYKIDLKFKTTGVNQGWFKVYACTTKPTAGAEYKGDILVSEVAIWANSNAIDGQFSSLLNPDAGTKTGNVVTFTQSGTVYLSIQCGANSLQGGVSITNVEFRGVTSK